MNLNFIAESTTQIIISVRGTASFQDAVQDAEAKQVDFKEGKGQVHLGFYEGFGFVKQKLDAYLKKHPQADKTFVVTGHSLGAAVATLIAAYLREKITSKVILYTYGSPRVGNKTFADRYTRTKPFTYYRIVNGSDVVTMVPMPGIDLNPHLLPLGAGEPLLLPPGRSGAPSAESG